MANVQYNRIIRKIVVAFGDMFSNISLIRYNSDMTESERFLVPIIYATKERYATLLGENPNLDKKVQITLPRMSYEMKGMTYDASRKLNTNIKNFVQNTSGSVISNYNPVPYDFDFSLYLYVRNIEDGTQLIEYILPFFTPDYTINVNLIPELGITKEIPIILKDTNYEVEYEGPRENDTRVVIWTLNFTVKGFVFGQSSQVGLIKNSITNILNDITASDIIQLNMSVTGNGVYKTGEIVYQGYSPTSASGTAKVVQHANNVLTISNINGNFVSGKPIIGTQTNSNYSFVSYKIVPTKEVTIDVKPNPPTANATDPYTYNISVTELVK
jgi:hypothetical protein